MGQLSLNIIINIIYYVYRVLEERKSFYNRAKDTT